MSNQPCKFLDWIDRRRAETGDVAVDGLDDLKLSALTIEQIARDLLPPECWCHMCLGTKFLSGHPDVIATFLPDDLNETPRLLTPGEFAQIATTGQSLPGRIFIYRLNKAKLVPWSDPGVEAVERAIRETLDKI